MFRIFATEEFREVLIDERLKLRYAVSNYGRLISFTHTFDDGRLVKGSMTNGYRIWRYKIKDGDKYLHRHKFFYRMVAEAFLPTTMPEQTYILHKDFNIANDNLENLCWSTKEEMYAHQQLSPKVIDAKKKLAISNREREGHKLTSTQVMLIKKQLANPNRKTRMKMIAKQFGISEMQLYRIKSGENWGHIKID